MKKDVGVVDIALASSFFINLPPRRMEISKYFLQWILEDISWKYIMCTDVILLSLKWRAEMNDILWDCWSFAEKKKVQDNIF